MTGMHIEFTGISGVGKSSVIREISEFDSYYQDYSPKAVLRTYSKPVAIVLRQLPAIVQTKITKLTWSRREMEFYREYLRDHQEFTELSDFIDTWADFDKNRLAELLIQTAARYQLGISTVRPGEHLLIDEGFFHRGASIAARNNEFDIPIETYFKYVPLPEVVVHVTAPDNTINQRLQARENITHDRSRLADNKKFIERMVKLGRKHNVHIIHLDNSENLDSTVSALQTALTELG